MAKEAVFTMKLEAELRCAFMAATEAAHRPASQVVRELMRDYVRRRIEEQERGEFLRRSVQMGSALRAGRSEAGVAAGD